MKISFIAAMSENRVIGQKGQLPWHLPNDLKHFKKLTLHRHILMGSKTFRSLKNPLPNRYTYVLTKTGDIIHPDIIVFHSKDEVLQCGLLEIIVIGGEEVFNLFMPECERIYLTIVHSIIPGDRYFPVFTGFTEISREHHNKDMHHKYSYSFIEYVKSRLLSTD
jgi:dihydrofolate reductase